MKVRALFLAGALVAAVPATAYVQWVGVNRLAACAIERELRKVSQDGLRESYSRYKAFLTAKGVVGQLRGEDEAVAGREIRVLEFLRERAYPFDTVDWDYYNRRLANFEAMRRFTLRKIHPEAAKWNQVGPTNYLFEKNAGDLKDNRMFQTAGPVTGRATALTFENKSTAVMYMGSANGGLWKSTDMGVNWTPLIDTHKDWTRLTISSICIDPRDQKTVYVGTGDFWGVDQPGYGLMYTYDGGTTWKKDADFGTESISKIVLDHDNPDILVVTSGRGKQQTDTGEIRVWDPVNLVYQKKALRVAAWANVIQSVPSRSIGRRIYYAVGHRAGGAMQRCIDPLGTWTDLTAKLPCGGGMQFLQVAVSPTDANVVFLKSNTDKKIWRSLDYGDNWKELKTTDIAEFNQDWYNNCLIAASAKYFDTTRGHFLFAGQVGLYDNDDAQADDPTTLSWSRFSKDDTVDPVLHSDQHSHAMHPVDEALMLQGNDGGVFVFSFDGFSWDAKTLNKNLCISEFYHCDWSPTEEFYIAGGCQDVGSPTCRGTAGNWFGVQMGDGSTAAIAHEDKDLQYTSRLFGFNGNSFVINVTTDAWASKARDVSQTSAEPANARPPLVVNPGNGKDPLLARQSLFYLKDFAAGTWDVWSNNKIATNFATAMAWSTKDTQVVYTGSNDGEVYYSENQGADLIRIDWKDPADHTKGSFLNGRPVGHIDIDPDNPKRIILVLQGAPSTDDAGKQMRVWTAEVTDPATGKATWKNVDAGKVPVDMPAHCCAFDPTSPANTWYVGTEVGFFWTKNGGTAYVDDAVTNGLPKVSTRSMKVTKHGTKRYINVATYGRGVWRAELPL
ncbi:MAG: hypothetical protein HONBIEJF_00866 [Fimbriimonadaceae bacterium]|nr:hypothetical protein [Fimbriimonadaceae bacterium]